MDIYLQVRRTIGEMAPFNSCQDASIFADVLRRKGLWTMHPVITKF